MTINIKEFYLGSTRSEFIDNMSKKFAEENNLTDEDVYHYRLPQAGLQAQKQIDPDTAKKWI
jgi:hypothetical protein